MTRESTPEQASKEHGGFFSSARGFSLELGSQLEPGAVRGYYIDLRMKAQEPGWPPPWARPGEEYVDTCQWGLGSYERYLAGDGRRWLDEAVACAEYLLEHQERDGRQVGGWCHRKPFPHTFPLRPPWVSAMAQGQGASLFVRLHRESGDPRFADAARLALRPLRVASEDGGARASLAGGPFPEEYPTTPPSYVLNGAIFALWGVYDVSLGLGDDDAAAEWEAGIETLAGSIHRWDAGYWSRYDLFPHPIANIASSSYHVLHVSQLKVLGLIAPRREFAEMLARFEEYGRSTFNRRRAFAAKAVFRLLVPRNGRLASRLPWNPRIPDG